jgi:hypothetical protein
MANILSQAGIETTNTVEAWHVTQSIDAFTGVEAYDIIVSGSVDITGSLNNGLSNTTSGDFSHAEGYKYNSIRIIFTRRRWRYNSKRRKFTRRRNLCTTAQGDYSHAEGE